LDSAAFLVASNLAAAVAAFAAYDANSVLISVKFEIVVLNKSPLWIRQLYFWPPFKA
jgi:hypothetical protein